MNGILCSIEDHGLCYVQRLSQIVHIESIQTRWPIEACSGVSPTARPEALPVKSAKFLSIQNLWNCTAHGSQERLSIYSTELERSNSYPMSYGFLIICQACNADVRYLRSASSLNPLSVQISQSPQFKSTAVTSSASKELHLNRRR